MKVINNLLELSMDFLSMEISFKALLTKEQF